MEPYEVENINETINQRIARYRRLTGYSQKAMAAFLDKRPSTYSQEERCGDITCRDIIKISHILGIDVKVLLYGEKKGENIINNPPFILEPREKQLVKAIRDIKPKYRDLVFEMTGALLKCR